MNLFKGLLYLIDSDQPASPVLIQAPHYGAASAAKDFGDQLGNRAASQRRFGTKQIPSDASLDECLAMGGCR
jgi:hypothetical protein